jgi:hypothetical protein
MARQGATLAVERALQLAGKADATDMAASVRKVFAGVREELMVRAAAEGNSTSDYATTLAVTLLTTDTVCTGQIGDTIAVVDRESRYEAIAPAPRSEYVNETSFVTDDDALDRIRITAIPGVEVMGMFLFTDGLRFKILHDLATTAPYTPFFEDLAAYARSHDSSHQAVSKFLAEIDDQSGDDKTLVAAVRTERCKVAELEDEFHCQPPPNRTK